MRTRAQLVNGLTSPPPSSPPQSPHRQGATFADRNGTFNAQNLEPSNISDAPLTPRRSSKRVRFSDPGPIENKNKNSTRTSGLTPHLRRSTLSPSGLLPVSTEYRVPKRKASSAFLSPQSNPSSEIDLQYFTPLKQALDERTKRRLKRNHLSEETNDWEHEHRAMAKIRRELIHLREDYAQKEEQVQSLALEVELQTQRGMDVNLQEEEELHELRRELREMKERLALQENIVQEIVLDAQDDHNLASDLFDDDWVDDSITLPSSPSPHRSNSPVQELEKRTVAVVDQSCHVNLPDPNHEAHTLALEETITQLAEHNEDAREALQLVRRELYNLGFSTDEGAGADQLLADIREAFRTARLDLERILPGETQGGLDSAQLLIDSLLGHLRTLHELLQSSEKTADRHRQAERALRVQFNKALVKLSELEMSITEIMQHRTQLIDEAEMKEHTLEAIKDELKQFTQQADANNHRVVELAESQRVSETTIERLQHAVKTYADEAKSLEVLLAQLEEEKRSLSVALDEVSLQSNEKLKHLERRHEEATDQYEGRIAELEQDLIRAEEEVTIDREKLRNEKEKSREEKQKMNMRYQELQKKQREIEESDQKLLESNNQLSLEIENIQARYVEHGRTVAALFDQARDAYNKLWRSEEDFLRLRSADIATG